MPSFQERFIASKGQPIEYEGKILLMVDFYPIEDGTRLRLSFESSDGLWRQGVSLRMREKGTVLLNGVQGRHFTCWRDTAPESFDLEIKGPASKLAVYNVWDSGNGATDAWHNGAAMIVEEIPQGRRYLCNDGYADDDFNDLIFRIEKLA